MLRILILGLITVLLASATVSARQSGTSPAPETGAPCPANSAASSADCKTASAKPKPKQKHTAAPAASTTQNANPTSDQSPHKTVVRQGSTADPTIYIVTDLTPKQAAQTTEQTKRLIETANADLKTAEARPLTDSQKDTVKQIRVYMKQSDDAKSEGDLQRAYNLANKAKMLSADLIGK